jgi:hypothetical protein
MLIPHCLLDENGTCPTSAVNEIENSMKNRQIQPKRRHSWPSEKPVNKNMSDGNMNESLSFIGNLLFFLCLNYKLKIHFLHYRRNKKRFRVK